MRPDDDEFMGFVVARYAQLLAQGGLYADLYRTQFRGSDEATQASA